MLCGPFLAISSVVGHPAGNRPPSPDRAMPAIWQGPNGPACCVAARDFAGVLRHFPGTPRCRVGAVERPPPPNWLPPGYQRFACETRVKTAKLRSRQANRGIPSADCPGGDLAMRGFAFASIAVFLAWWPIQSWAQPLPDELKTTSRTERFIVGRPANNACDRGVLIPAQKHPAFCKLSIDECLAYPNAHIAKDPRGSWGCYHSL